MTVKWTHRIESNDLTDEDFTNVVGREPRSHDEFDTWANVVERRREDYTDWDAVFEDAIEAINDQAIEPTTNATSPRSGEAAGSSTA